MELVVPRPFGILQTETKEASNRGGLMYRRSGWPRASRGRGESIRDGGSEQPALGQLEQDRTLGIRPGLLCPCETFLGILPVFFRGSHHYPRWNRKLQILESAIVPLLICRYLK